MHIQDTVATYMYLFESKSGKACEEPPSCTVLYHPVLSKNGVFFSSSILEAHQLCKLLIHLTHLQAVSSRLILLLETDSLEPHAYLWWCSTDGTVLSCQTVGSLSYFYVNSVSLRPLVPPSPHAKASNPCSKAINTVGMQVCSDGG